MNNEQEPIRVFVSYSHADDDYRIRLEKELKLIERQGLIATWSDRKLLPGDRWEKGVEQELDRADLILFLVSSDFVASEFIWSREMTRAMERHKRAEARVVPVILRPTGNWQRTPFGSLQAVPKDGLAVSDPKWGTPDNAWADVAERLRILVELLARKRSSRFGETGGDRRSEDTLAAIPDPSRYLEAVESRNSFVEIRGIGAHVAEQLPLDRVFTNLRVARVGPGFDTPTLRNLNDTERLFKDLSHEYESLELSDVLRQSRHAVLVGDPGSGKTTFLRFAAQVLARSIITSDSELASREIGVESDPSEEIPLPIFVRLDRFADFLRDHPSDSYPDDASEHLLRFLEFDLKGRNLDLPDDYLRRRVVTGGCFLLLDGLDEVPGTVRTRVVSIVDEVVATTPTSPANRHLITCRTGAYRGLARPNSLPAYTIAPFREQQVATFVRGWSKALFQVRQRRHSLGTEQNAERYAVELMDAIRSHGNLGPLASNPLMLTMLAVVHWNRRKLPERRNELYEEAVNYLLESRKEHSSFPAPQRREALQALALAMFTDGDGVQRSLGLAEAGVVVAPLLQSSEEEGRVFLDEEALHSGLLVSRTEGEVEFWHLSFQEYLAALELATSGDYWNVLCRSRRLQDDAWSEVVLLLAGCLRRLGGLRAASRLIRRIIEDGMSTSGLGRALALVGRILTDIKLYGGDPSLGTGYSEILKTTLTIFEPPVEGEAVLDEATRIEIAQKLGEAGDPRLADPDTNWVILCGGSFLMGAQNWSPEGPAFDPEAYEDESPVRRVTVSSFVMSRYPVSVQEYRRFLEAEEEGYLNPLWWIPDGWAWRAKSHRVEPNSWDKQILGPNRPVTWVSWYEAAAYCSWVGGRLPSEAEWEFAARGQEGRRYPWGDEAPNQDRANFGAKALTPVGIYPLGTSRDGIHDLAGNVLEWCYDRFDAYPVEDEEDPVGPTAGRYRVLRGGSCASPTRILRAACRIDLAPPNLCLPYIGFRVARNLSVHRTRRMPQVPLQAASA